jgi:hypothetical protein
LNGERTTIRDNELSNLVVLVGKSINAESIQNVLDFDQQEVIKYAGRRETFLSNFESLNSIEGVTDTVTNF